MKEFRGSQNYVADEELLRAVHTIDPHAFLTVQEGTHIYGNFTRKLE